MEFVKFILVISVEMINITVSFFYNNSIYFLINNNTIENKKLGTIIYFEKSIKIL